MPKIPININDIPTEDVAMDEALVYKGFCRSLILSDQPSKSGLMFLKARWEVTEPDDYRGKLVLDNYIPIPTPLPPEVLAAMDDRQRARAMEPGVRFGRMCRSMGYEGDPAGFDTDEAIGKEATFMIQNEKFNGRNIARIAEYLLV